MVIKSKLFAWILKLKLFSSKTAFKQNSDIFYYLFINLCLWLKAHKVVYLATIIDISKELNFRIIRIKHKNKNVYLKARETFKLYT